MLITDQRKQTACYMWCNCSLSPLHAGQCRDVCRGSPRSAVDLMNEQVCHVEIVILTTYISVSGLLWKSNWHNYSGGGTFVRGSGAFPEQSFLCGSNMETTHRLHVKFNQRPEQTEIWQILHWAAESDHLDLTVEQTQKIKSSASYCRYFMMSYEIFLFRREQSVTQCKEQKSQHMKEVVCNNCI